MKSICTFELEHYLQPTVIFYLKSFQQELRRALASYTFLFTPTDEFSGIGFSSIVHRSCADECPLRTMAEDVMELTNKQNYETIQPSIDGAQHSGNTNKSYLMEVLFVWNNSLY